MSKLPRILPLIAVAIGGVIAIRAAGVAPGVFDGARAWAAEAVSEGAAPQGEAAKTPAPAVCALTPEQLAQQAGISPAELRILQSLNKRRGELDARDADFATTLPLLMAAEQKLDAKVQALESLKGEIRTLLGQVDEQEKAEMDRLVAVYSAMRPKEAAAVFVTLDDSVRLPVAGAMRPRTLAAVMAQMPPAAARELTEKLARRFEQQQAAARAAIDAARPAAATEPAPAPTPAPAAATPAETPAARPAANRPAANRPAANRAAATPRPTPAASTQNRPAATPAAGPAATPAETGAASQPRQSVQ